MAPAIEKEALEFLAKELETVASWHTGARESHLQMLADRVRSVADGSHGEWFGPAKEAADAQAKAAADLAAERDAQAAADAAAQAAAAEAAAKAQADNPQ